MFYLPPARVSAIAVVGLVSGLAMTWPGPDSPASPTPTPSATALPGTPSPSPSGRPTATVTTWPTATGHPAQSPSGHVIQRKRSRPSGTRPATTTSPAPAGIDQPDGSGGRGLDAAWTSFLPTPETGLKIFAGGLVALAVSIGGLAALAIRRRTY